MFVWEGRVVRRARSRIANHVAVGLIGGDVQGRPVSLHHGRGAARSYEA